MAAKSFPQFSILQLVVFITVAAMGLVAMTRYSPFLFALFATVSAICFLFALLMVIFHRGASQAYWIGFSAWGLGYLLLFTYVDKGQVTDSFLTTQLLRASYGQLIDSILDETDFNDTGETSTPFGPPLDEASFIQEGDTVVALGDTGPLIPDLDMFMDAGQLLWAWLFAALGGWLAVICYRRAKALGRPGEES